MIGTLQLVTAAMGMVGSFFDGTARPMLIGIAVCAVVAFALTRLTIKPAPAEMPAAAEQT